MVWMPKNKRTNYKPTKMNENYIKYIQQINVFAVAVFSISHIVQLFACCILTIMIMMLHENLQMEKWEKKNNNKKYKERKSKIDEIASIELFGLLALKVKIRL